MKFLYSMKGCSYCGSRGYCPKKLKNSEANLIKKPRQVKENGRKWISYCKDFFRGVEAK